MKAVVYHRYGSPDVLAYKDIEKPIPTDNEVLIKVHAASLNSWDWDLLRGKPLVYRLLFGLVKPKYNILGADIAGKVEAVGKSVKQFQVGDEVFGDISGCHWGGFAEYVCADENVLALKSSAMTFEQAASLPQAAVLALQALKTKRPIQQGQKVLINGAGGGVGTIAIQISKSYGAEVTGVDSASKLALLRSLGADLVIDYAMEDFTKNGKHYDVILDVVGSRSIFDYKRALVSKGTYVMIGGYVSRILQVALLGPLLAITGKKMGLLVHRPNKQDLNVMSELVESGEVIPVIDRCYPLPETAEAFQYFGEGQMKGKVVISVAQHDNQQ